MSTAYGPYIIIEIPVMTGIVATAIGYYIRRANIRRDAMNQRRDDVIDSHTEALTTQSLALNTLVGEVKPISDRLLSVEGKLGRMEITETTLRETTAVLAATLEHHQLWHERQPSPPQRRD
jgi:hypothetical protein